MAYQPVVVVDLATFEIIEDERFKKKPVELPTEPLVLDIARLSSLTGYCHWIPAQNGSTEKMMKKNYPGWHWNELVPPLFRKGIIVLKGADEALVSLRMGLGISPDIKAIQFTKSEAGVKVKVIKNRARKKA